MKLNNQGDLSGSRKRLRRTLVFSLIVVLTIVRASFYSGTMSTNLVNNLPQTSREVPRLRCQADRIRLRQRFR